MKKHDRTNFETLLVAAGSGDLAILDCLDVRTLEPVAVVIAVSRTDDGGADMVPLARLFSSNPYADVLPPNPDRTGEYFTADGRSVAPASRTRNGTKNVQRLALVQGERTAINDADIVTDILRIVRGVDVGPAVTHDQLTDSSCFAFDAIRVLLQKAGKL